MAKKKTKNPRKKVETPVVETVMRKIEAKEVSMMPKAYFLLGSVLLGMSTVGVFGMAVLFAGVWVFQMRAKQLFGPLGLEVIRRPALLPHLPWAPFLVALLGLIVGLALIKKYDFAYKRNWGVIILGMLVGVILMVILIDRVGINDRLSETRGFREVYKTRQLREKEVPELREAFIKRGVRPEILRNNPQVRGQFKKR